MSDKEKKPAWWAWVVLVLIAITIPAYIVSGFWTSVISIVVAFVVLGIVAGMFNIDMEKSKAIGWVFILSCCFSVGMCSSEGDGDASEPTGNEQTETKKNTTNINFNPVGGKWWATSGKATFCLAFNSNGTVVRTYRGPNIYGQMVQEVDDAGNWSISGSDLIIKFNTYGEEYFEIHDDNHIEGSGDTYTRKY